MKTLYPPRSGSIGKITIGRGPSIANNKTIHGTVLYQTMAKSSRFVTEPALHIFPPAVTYSQEPTMYPAFDEYNRRILLANSEWASDDERNYIRHSTPGTKYASRPFNTHLLRP